jgi:mannose-6-phosphate isomerase-like protein (cupin superfamily)
MPFGSQHQHFNTGTTPVRYFSAMALHIEHWMGMGKLDQISLKGPTDNYEDAEVSTSGFDTLNRRIAFRRNEQEEVTLDELDPNDVEEITGEPMTIDPDGPRPTQMSERGHRDFMRSLMDRPGRNGFQNKEIEISNTMGDQVGHHGGKHAHMEAVLLILDGEGYSEVGDVKVPWKKGSLLHVQGPQTPHQHFNTGTERVEMLRAAPGMRFNFMQPIAKERFPYLWFSHRGVNDSSVTNPWA